MAMPRQRRQPERRRRTGCWQCKDGHLQCTEELPRCKRCQRLGLDCVRKIKLLWREDAAQRGIHFGREGTWSKRCSKIKKPPETDIGRIFRAVPTDQYAGRWIFLNTTYQDFGNGSGQLARVGAQASSLLDPQTWHFRQQVIQNSCLRTSRLSHPLSAYSAVDGYLLDYFVQSIAPECSLSHRYNPYLMLVTPMIFSHFPLRNTLLAISANQLRLLGDNRFEKEAYVYNQRALNGLQAEINRGVASYEAVATILMLCFHDITDGCSPSWVTHLRGGLKLLDIMPSTSTESHILKQFFVMYFVAHDIMGATALEDASAVHFSDHLWLDDDDLDVIDMLMGCSRGLMSLISRISQISSERSKILKMRPLSQSEVSYFTSARDSLESALHTLRQTLPSYCNDREDCLRIAETKRLTAFLFLCERLGYPTQSYSFVRIPCAFGLQAVNRFDLPCRVPLTPGAVDRSPDACKSRLISGIISLVSALPDSATLLWPLFVIGTVGLDDEGDRRFVLERLERIQQSRNLGSVRKARKAVEYACRSRDLGYPQGKSWGGSAITSHEIETISLA